MNYFLKYGHLKSLTCPNLNFLNFNCDVTNELFVKHNLIISDLHIRIERVSLRNVDAPKPRSHFAPDIPERQARSSRGKILRVAVPHPFQSVAQSLFYDCRCFICNFFLKVEVQFSKIRY